MGQRRVLAIRGTARPAGDVPVVEGADAGWLMSCCETIERLPLEPHGDATEAYAWSCLRLKHHKLSAGQVNDFPIELHHAMTGMDVATASQREGGVWI